MKKDVEQQRFYMRRDSDERKKEGSISADEAAADSDFAPSFYGPVYSEQVDRSDSDDPLEV